jgi:hypothetical protein
MVSDFCCFGTLAAPQLNGEVFAGRTDCHEAAVKVADSNCNRIISIT